MMHDKGCSNKLSEKTINTLAISLGLEQFSIVSNKNSHVVLQTPNFFYKIRKFAAGDPTAFFARLIINAYAEQYKKIGLTWACRSHYTNSAEFLVEKRDKIKPISTKKCSLEDALKISSNFTEQVERDLGFVQLVAQVKSRLGVDNIEKVKLTRQSKTTLQDFGIFNNKCIVFPCDTYRLTLPSDSTCSDQQIFPDTFRVTIKAGEFYFGPSDFSLYDKKLGNGMFLNNKQWCLYDLDYGKEMYKKRSLCVQQRKLMNAQNLELLSTKKLVKVISQADVNPRDDESVKQHFCKLTNENVNSLNYLREILKKAPGVRNVLSISKNDDLGNLGFDVWRGSNMPQIVLKKGAYFYKIYEVIKGTCNEFDQLIRQCLAEIYRNVGIKWTLYTFDLQRTQIVLEKRQELKLANSSDNGSFENVLLSISKHYDMVEHKLEFDKILKQLVQIPEFSKVKKLKLNRYMLNKSRDYAFFENQAILLDDTEFCIQLLDENGALLDIEYYDDVKIETSYGKLLFKKINYQHLSEGINYPLNSVFESIYQAWVLIPQGNNNQASSDTETSLHLFSFKEMNGLKNKFVKQTDEACFFESNLTEYAQSELYENLDSYTAGHSKSMWVCTNLNKNKQLLNGREYASWASHMKTISTYYFPTAKTLTTIYLTREFCQRYISGKIKIDVIRKKYATIIRFLPPSSSLEFPSRSLFRKFLLKYAKSEIDNSDLFFLPEGIAHGYSFAYELSSSNHKINSLCLKNHPAMYNCYSDTNGCMLCDFEQIILSASN